MNGFMMCVLLAATGQVGDAPERDYSWQINPEDGKLEYIVQLSPDEANFMVKATKEHASDVPPEVAARLSRVVVRIGTEPLISTPMEEVLKIPVVTTAVLANIEPKAGPGRYSNLESAPSGEVLPVAGDKSPPPLTSSQGTPLPAFPSATLADQASQLGGQIGSKLGSDALRKAENLLAQNLAQTTPGSGFLNDSRGVSAGSGKFSSTATQPAAPPAGSTTNPPSGSPSNLGGTAQPGSNYPTSPTHNHAPGDGYHNDGTVAAPLPGSSIGNPPTGGFAGNTQTNPGYQTGNGSAANGSYGGTQNGSTYNPNGGYAGGSTPGYNNNATQGYGSVPNYANNSNSGMAPINNGNFGGLPRGAANQPAYNQYATTGNSQYPYAQSTYPYPQNSNPTTPIYGPNSPYATDPLALPRQEQPPLRIADRGSSAVPSTSGGGTPAAGSETAGKTGKGSGASKASDNDTSETYANNHSGMDNVLPVMFVLSLVVNFYLGMLIRKLLARYRSLLSSVRSQAV